MERRGIIINENELKTTLCKIGEMANEISNIITYERKRTYQIFHEKGIFEMVKNFKNGLIDAEKDLKIFKEAIVELGYPPHIGMDIPTMRMIAENFNNDKVNTIEDINDFMVEYYNTDVLNEIADLWESNELLSSRIHILRKVLTAHKLGFYDLSIPTLIPQFEGLLIDAFEITGFTNGEVSDILLKTLLLKEDYENGFSFDKEVHRYYKEKILANFKHGKDAISEISRNAILHGADRNYGTLYNSLKLILLFDNIAQSLQFMKKETKTLGHKRGMKIVRKLEKSYNSRKENKY